MIALMPAFSDQSEGWPSPSCHPLSDPVLTVVPTGLHDDVELVSRRFVVEPHPTTCPMLVDGVRGARCVMRGGPWTSASIQAAAIWTDHRRLLLARFACAACENGRCRLWGRSAASGAHAR